MDSEAVTRLLDPPSDNPLFQSSAYVHEGLAGEGAFGVVIKAFVVVKRDEKDTSHRRAQHPLHAHYNNLTHKRHYVAIKQMMNHREGSGIPQDAYREIKILRELRHENLVRLENVFLRPERKEIDLVYEWAEHDLADIIKSSRQKVGRIDPRIVKSILWQILQGIAYLHENWVMHRDVKPANILIMGMDSEEAGRVKIGDFGLARIFQSPSRSLAHDGEVVTIWYRAPELLLGSQHYTRAIDIWAVGCIFVEMLTCSPLFPGEEAKGKQPFQENQLVKICRILGVPTDKDWPGITSLPHYTKFQKLTDENARMRKDDLSRNLQELRGFPDRSLLPHFLRNSQAAQVPPDSNAAKLAAALLTFDPMKRITAEDALRHPYFTESPLPDRNCFLDSNGASLRYLPRSIKHLSSSKRVREGDIGVAGGVIPGMPGIQAPIPVPGVVGVGVGVGAGVGSLHNMQIPPMNAQNRPNVNLSSSNPPIAVPPFNQNALNLPNNGNNHSSSSSGSSSNGVAAPGSPMRPAPPAEVLGSLNNPINSNNNPNFVHHPSVSSSSSSSSGLSSSISTNIPANLPTGTSVTFQPYSGSSTQDNIRNIPHQHPQGLHGQIHLNNSNKRQRQ